MRTKTVKASHPPSRCLFSPFLTHSIYFLWHGQLDCLFSEPGPNVWLCLFNEPGTEPSFAKLSLYPLPWNLSLCRFSPINFRCLSANFRTPAVLSCVCNQVSDTLNLAPCDGSWRATEMPYTCGFKQRLWDGWVFFLFTLLQGQRNCHLMKLCFCFTQLF